MSERKFCAATLWKDMHRSSCSRSGSVYENGRWWCKQHSPSAVAKRAADSDARWKKQWAERKAGWAREDAFKKVAETAVALFRQKATMEDLEKAVAEYERLKVLA